MNPISITERLANLSPAKPALLEQRLKGKGLAKLTQLLERLLSQLSIDLVEQKCQDKAIR